MVGQLSREEIDAPIWRSVIADGVYEELTSQRDRCASPGRSNQVLAVQVPCGAGDSDHVIDVRIRLLEMTDGLGRDL